MAFPALGQTLLLRLFIRLLVNFTLQFRLWNSPCSAELCKEKQPPTILLCPILFSVASAEDQLSQWKSRGVH